jgi:hypothetical protein
MKRWSFNLTVPIFDWLYGTVWSPGREAPGDARRATRCREREAVAHGSWPYPSPPHFLRAWGLRAVASCAMLLSRLIHRVPRARVLACAAALAASCAPTRPPARPPDACKQAGRDALRRDLSLARATAAELDRARARLDATPAEAATRGALAGAAFDALMRLVPDVYVSPELPTVLSGLSHAVARVEDGADLAAALGGAAESFRRFAEALAPAAEEPGAWSNRCAADRADAAECATTAVAARADTTETARRLAAVRAHAEAVADADRCLDEARRQRAQAGSTRTVTQLGLAACETRLYGAYERCKAEVGPLTPAIACTRPLFVLLARFAVIHHPDSDHELSRREGSYLRAQARGALDLLGASPLSELREVAWARLAAEQMASATEPHARFAGLQRLMTALQALEQPCLELLLKKMEIHCTPEPSRCPPPPPTGG